MKVRFVSVYRLQTHAEKELEFMGADSIKLLPIFMVFGMFAIFIIAGLRGRRKSVVAYGVTGGYSGPLGIGAAIASNWMSAASFLGLAGMFYLKGYHAMAYVIGWTGGYVLLLVLMASQIRRFGKYSAPDFIGFRYGSDAARSIAACISILIIIIYSAAQFRGIALIVSWLFNLSYTAAVVVGASLVVTFVVVSGILGVTRNQKLQYAILIVAFIVPLMLLTRKLGYFWILPQFGYGAALQELDHQFSFVWSAPFVDNSLFSWIALCFSLMFGTAGLPHVLSRFYMTPGMRDARWGVVWGLFFIALIYWSAPAYSVLARLFEARNNVQFNVDPNNADMVIFSAVTQGAMPLWVAGLLAAGAMSAAFSAVSGLLLSGAASFGYDIFPRLIRPNSSETDKVYASKGFFLLLAVLVMLLALKPFGMIAETAALAFALAGNTIFPAFLLGIWNSRVNASGVLAGMFAGVIITFAPLIMGDSVPLLSALFPATSSAFLGMPLVTVIMMLVSLATAPPDPKIVEFLYKEIHDGVDE